MAAMLLPMCCSAQVQSPSHPEPDASIELPREQIAAGYSFLNLKGTQFSNLPAGYLVDSNFFFGSHLGIQVESGGHWGNNVSIGTVEAGPVIRTRYHRLTPFAHGNVGFARVTAAGITNFGWGAAMGAGLDLRLTHRFELRLLDLDYVYNGVTFSASSPQVDQHGLRYSGGIVWNIGSIKPKP